MITREDIFKLVLSFLISITILVIATTLLTVAIELGVWALILLPCLTFSALLSRWYLELYFIGTIQRSGEVLNFIEKVISFVEVLTLLLVFMNLIGLITITMWR